MTFKQVKDLLDIGFIPSIVVAPSSNNSYSSDKKVAQGNPLDNPTNSNITQIIGYETQTGEYNEEEITAYTVKLTNGHELYALNQNDDLSKKRPLLSEPEELADNEGGAVLK